MLDESSIFLQKETFGLVKMMHTHCENKNPQQYRKYKTRKKLMTKPDPRDDLLTVWQTYLWSSLHMNICAHTHTHILLHKWDQIIYNVLQFAFLQ